MASIMPRFQTVVEALQHWAQEKPDSTAVIFRDKNHQRHLMTWASLYRLSGRFAAVLRSKGLGHGDLVINTLTNSPERVVCEAGIWMSGAASVTGQCLLPDGSDLLNTARVSRAPVILVDPDVQDSPWNVLKHHVVLHEDDVTSSSLPCLKKVFFVRRAENEGEGGFIDNLKTLQDCFQADDVSPEDIFSVFSTSGTTGLSKLVIHTNKTILGYIMNDTAFVDSFIKQPLQFTLAPQGWMGACLPMSVVPGATSIVCDDRDGIPEDMARFIWKTIQEEKCICAAFSPIYLPHLVGMAEIHKQKCDSDPGLFPVWKLDVIALGGQPINQAMVEAALTIAHTVCFDYGSTETGTISSHLVTDTQSYLDHDAGKPIKNIEVKIAHPDDEDIILAATEVGNILVKGPFMMKGYLNDPQATTEALTKDGFFRISDLGHLDERGHLIVFGRRSDAIRRGPSLVHPTLMEKRIQACPGVGDVIVVGVPDEHVNEELCACVVLDSDAVSVEHIRQFMEKVASFDSDPLSHRPKYYLRFESFPRPDTWKPKRKDIKMIAAQRLGLSQKNE